MRRIFDPHSARQLHQKTQPTGRLTAEEGNDQRVKDGYLELSISVSDSFWGRSPNYGSHINAAEKRHGKQHCIIDMFSFA
jgi:hypothetical protein